MAYRNGTYIAFHAEGTSDPTASDIKYFNMLKAWHQNDSVDFKFVNSHEKVSAVRDTSARETLRRSLVARMSDSKNMVLIVGQRTKYDTDWVPFEIEQAIDRCGLPIIAAYPGYTVVLNTNDVSELWPRALAMRITTGAARVIHVPFQRSAIDAALRKFDVNNLPASSYETWTLQTHRNFGIRI